MTQEQQREVAANDHATAQWKEQPIEREGSFENWQNCKDDFVAGAEWEGSRDKWIKTEGELPPIDEDFNKFSKSVRVITKDEFGVVSVGSVSHSTKKWNVIGGSNGKIICWTLIP